MAEKTNSFIGIASGSAVSTGNSGGDSGDAFDAVTSGVTVESSADITAAYDRGIVPALSDATNSFVQWAIPSSTSGYARFYFRTSTVPGGYTTRLWRGMAANGTTVRCEVRIEGANNWLVFSNQLGEHIARYESLAANTIYRVEVNWSSGSPSLRVYPGESTTSDTINIIDGTSAISEVSFVRYGLMVSSNQTVSPVHMAAVGWSDTTWLGPVMLPAEATYQLTITHAVGSASIANRSYRVDTTDSTGTTSLVQTSGPSVAISETSTGVFRFDDPGEDDMSDVSLRLSAGTSTVDIVIPRQQTSSVVTRPATLTYYGGGFDDITNFG